MHASLTLLAMIGVAAAPAGGDTEFATQLARDVPKLAFLRAHDPSTFATIVDIYAAGRRAGRSQEEMIGQARTAFARAQATRMATAPDRLILQAFDYMIATVRDLEASSPEQCAALLAGGNAGDIKPFLSPETIAREDRFYEAVFATEPAAHVATATAEDEQRVIGEVLAREAGKTGQTPRAIVEEASSAPGSYCTLQRTLFEGERAAPNAAALFRRRVAAGGTP